jgi:glutathione S-transferase
LPFEEIFLSLDQEGYGDGKIAEIRAASPSGRVPALHVGGAQIWDSLAISEWIAEAAPEARLWPTDSLARAQARAVSAEMHSGFAALRRDLPMNIRRRCAAQDWPRDTQLDLERINEMWTNLRQTHRGQGAHLCGARSIADAFYTPVAARLRTYAVSLSETANAYRDTLLADPAFQRWEQRAISEWTHPFSRAPLDALYT